MKLPALILAAGASRRLGCPKQAVRVAGEPLVHRAARAALEAGFAPVRVVFGCRHEELAPLVADLPVEVVINEGWEEGMAASIRAGLEALPEDAAGVALLVCDQVHLEAEVLQRLRQAFASAPLRPAACVYQERRGVPAILPAQAFPLLRLLRGDQGARDHLRGSDLSLIPWPEGAIDLDDPNGLQDLQASV